MTLRRLERETSLFAGCYTFVTMTWTSVRARVAGLLALGLLPLGLLALSPAALAWGGGVRPALDTTGYSAALEQCVSSVVPTERSVTFVGQMTAVPGTRHMGMRIELQQHVPGEAGFHEVNAPGLGVWRGSEAGVKIYKYVKQITNLAAPAVYRAVVHFRWVGDHGRLLKHTDLRSARCVQSVAPSAPSSKT
jgi:hypothetical protein